LANTHVTAANRYAREVVAGKIPACKWTILACKRHLDNLEQARQSRKYPFYFDADAAEAACLFIELLPHVKGKWARRKELIVLSAWQLFVVCSIFGWKRMKDDKRRFREAYVIVPRKNGKSALAAGIGLYMLAGDGEHGAEVYSGATTEKQAWEVFRPARQMVERTPDLIEAAGLEVWAKSIVCPENGDRFEPIIGKPGDGASPSCAILDEFHEHDTSEQYDTMVSGTGARDEPLILIITTAGYNLAGPCYDKDQEVRKVLEGVFENDELFGVIYGIDDKDDWADPKVLVKANPNYGISVDADYLGAQQRAAVTNAAHQTRFLTKHLNRWVSASVAWMPMVAWEMCGDPALDPDELAGEECVTALDLASKLDICANVKLFTKELNGQRHYYAFGRYYLPEQTVEEAKNNQTAYRKWVRQGLLTLTEGAELDFDVVGADVLADKSQFQIREIVYDPWRATHLAHQLMKDGAEVVEFAQNRHSLIAQAADELLAAVKAGRFHHNGDPIMKWMVSNVVLKMRNGVGVPTKEKPDNKIDGAVALIMAMARSMAPIDHHDISDFLNNPITA